MNTIADRRRRFARLACAAGLAATLVAGTARADDYPTRPITLVVAYAAGGNVDVTARLLAPIMSKALGQSVVVENRTGAGGTVGSAFVARARPDGYTLMLGSTGSNATAPALIPTAGYDPVNDFSIVGGVSTTPSVVVVPPGLPVKSYAELVALSKVRAQGISMGSPGTGSLNHLTLEVLKAKTGLAATHVPYRGAGPALADLAGGQIEAMVDQISSSMIYLRDGRLKAIAQSGVRRSALLPDVPTFREQGIDDVDVAVYTGLFAPAGLSDAVSARLRRALALALADTAVIERFAQQGSEPITSDAAAFAAHVAREATFWRDLVRAAGISAAN